MKKISAFALALLLAACGSKLDGTYKEASSGETMTFKGDKVIISTMGVKQETDYKVEDKQVKITSPMGILVMSINSDGSIEGPGGSTFRKQ